MLCIFNIGGYIMSEVKQELVMETTHGRKPKCKTEFKAVMNKVLVSGLILTTLLSSTIMPAMAADKNYIHLDNNIKIYDEGLKKTRNVFSNKLKSSIYDSLYAVNYGFWILSVFYFCHLYRIFTIFIHLYTFY